MTDLQLLSKRQVIGCLSISKTTLDVWRREHGFPQPIRICGINRWRPADIEAWLAKTQLRMDAGSPRSEASGPVQLSDG